MTNNFLQKHLDLFTLNLWLDHLTLLLFNTGEFLKRNSCIYSRQHKAKETTETQNPIEEAEQIGQSTKIRFLVAEKEEREEGFAKVEIRLAPFLSNVELDELNTPHQLLLETFEKDVLNNFFYFETLCHYFMLKSNHLSAVNSSSLLLYRFSIQTYFNTLFQPSDS